MKAFGCQGWMMIIPRGDKFDSRAKELRMVGYGRTGYKVWDPKTDDILIKRDIKFNEKNIKYCKMNEQEEVEIEIEIKDKGKSRIRRDDEVNERQENYYEIVNDENEERKENENVEEKRTTSGRIIHKPKHLQEYELYEAYCLLNNEEEPQSYEEAINEGWTDAINTELQTLQKMNTWTETTLPKNKKAIDTKWLFKTKDNGREKS